ncbi:MAG: FecR domain-containing protein, partial [Deltaproteobacteria bacterium]|nr:FecR domain-containing protein [Deltaproteobacteria bacterium]
MNRFPARLWPAFLLVLIAALVLGRASEAPAQGQEALKIVVVSGRAEILAAGRTVPAKSGAELRPGQTVRLAGGGEVRLLGDGFEVIGRQEAVLRYEGSQPAEALPWGAPLVVKAGAGQAEPTLNLAVGEAEARVTPGRPLRLFTPLVTAAARGTHFIISAAPDGSSAVRALAGRVEAWSRLGEMRTLGPGGSLSLSSGRYLEFLRQNGVQVQPGADWKALDGPTFERMDARAFQKQVNSAAGAGPGAPASPAPSPMANLGALGGGLGVAAGATAAVPQAKTEPPPAVGVTTPGLTIFDMAKQQTNEFVSDD